MLRRKMTALSKLYRNDYASKAPPLENWNARVLRMMPITKWVVTKNC